MITTQTFVEDDTQVSIRKIDVTTDDSGCILGVRLTDLNGLVEIQIQPETKVPRFSRKQLSDTDRKDILRPGYKNFKSPWTEEDDQQLMDLFETLDGDLREIARVMQRTDNAIRLRLNHLNVAGDPKPVVVKFEEDLRSLTQKAASFVRQPKEQKRKPRNRRRDRSLKKT
jgi:hypothetical protein